MNVVVCVKPVKTKYICEGEDGWEINPYDRYALQEAVKLAGNLSTVNDKCKVTALSMSSLSAEMTIKQCYLLGCDHVILLSDKKFIGSDTYATSYILSKAISRIKPEYILFGKKSVDGETQQTVVAVSEFLDYALIRNVSKTFKVERDCIVAERLRDEFIEKVRVKAPCIIATNSFTEHRKTIGLYEQKRLKQKLLEIWDSDYIQVDEDKIGVNGSKTKVLEIEDRFSKRRGLRIEGDTQEMAAGIINVIKKISGGR